MPFRKGSAGVLHLTALRELLTTKHPDLLGSTLTSAELALQLLRYPYRQRFGAAAPGGGSGGGLLDVLDTLYTPDQVAGWLVVDDG